VPIIGPVPISISSPVEIDSEISATPTASESEEDAEDPAQVLFARNLLESISQEDLDSLQDFTPTPSIGDADEIEAPDPNDDEIEASDDPKNKPRGRTVKSSSHNNKKVRARQIKPGCRVSTQRKRLIYWCTKDSQRDCLSIELANTAFFYGTVTGGTAQGDTVSASIFFLKRIL
jgi:hypothetical protein